MNHIMNDTSWVILQYIQQLEVANKCKKNPVMGKSGDWYLEKSCVQAKHSVARRAQMSERCVHIILCDDWLSSISKYKHPFSVVLLVKYFLAEFWKKTFITYLYNYNRNMVLMTLSKLKADRVHPRDYFAYTSTPLSQKHRQTPWVGNDFPVLPITAYLTGQLGARQTVQPWECWQTYTHRGLYPPRPYL